MRVTEKGQVTIPKEIRDRLGIVPGSEVEFIAKDDAALLVKVNENSLQIRNFEEWAASVEGLLDLDGMTTDEYMEWLRGPREDLDRH
ncbi:MULTISPECIES: AbrB/MazE/SpoVT family DNA-binding domain-containing protein [Rhizobium]|uniref:AbrB family looped-hinge helix DNA binding protein n=1 Tax=Rhizobium viscosum TaxID=1673 RepID=A0ABR9IQK5_RHIVS|nr:MULTISPECIES: AbrB/MazE/SpoVT family DNA-binding domain-containing protein [Rhizobium]MBB3410878.1 AbrB family looped-hinge helix DNA binding protein [Rhizobium sp. BK316]MBE1505418.1 AbrB family looped-hinge helix DNA binding protein [Rhizobium viscosum]QWW67120.1 AbrB/MazE/SpoVT family DNA-binding domain-containing protein [Rhizobium sp. WYJ-E13]